MIKKVEPGRELSDSEKLRLVTLDDGEYVCSDADYAAELAYLKSKVDAGADFIITQMFFDTAVLLQFVKDCRSAGIHCPIMPGIMIIQSFPGFKRMTAFCKSRVPAAMLARLEAVKDDDAKVKEVGVALGTEACRELMAAGLKGLHLYTLNLEKATVGVLDNLGLAKPVEGEDDAE